MTPYEEWPDADLLEEANERTLPSSAVNFLDSLLARTGDGRPLTAGQREVLIHILRENDAR